MAKDMIFFIAFKACAGKKGDPINHNNYLHAVLFLSLITTIHLVQLLFIFNIEQIISGHLIFPFSLLYLGSIFMLIYMLIASFFKRVSLPRVLYQYSEKRVSKYARYIGMGYILINVCTLLVIWNR